MKLIYVCNPYKSDVDYNIAKARGYCCFAYTQGVVPLWSRSADFIGIAQGI